MSDAMADQIGVDGCGLFAAIDAGMTPREAAVWERVRVAAGAYLRLTDDEPHHPMEREEICHAFHVIQGWLGARPFVRALGAAPVPPVETGDTDE